MQSYDARYPLDRAGRDRPDRDLAVALSRHARGVALDCVEDTRGVLTCFT